MEANGNPWGFDLDELYRLSLSFFKEKEGKAMHLTYKDKLKLVAYTKQVAHGKYRTDVFPEVGLLDVVGNDRRSAWQSLGDMSRESAMAEFVKMLDRLCPLLKPFIQAHRTERDEKRRKEEEEERMRLEEEEVRKRKEMEEAARLQQELERQRQLVQEMQIRTALNQQTAIQFQQYAEAQIPNNKEQQGELIAQLQEQHFQQYMQQVYQQQLLHQQQQFIQMQTPKTDNEEATPAHNNIINNNNINNNDTGEGPDAVQKEKEETGDATPIPPEGTTEPVDEQEPVEKEAEEDVDVEDDEGEPSSEIGENGELSDLPPLAAASIWTRKNPQEFKTSLKNEKDCILRVGSGETVTVRVPTHEDGSCLFWEFATDSYDIGFGIFFEWTVAPSNTVSVHISDSSDEDELDEEDDTSKVDPERGIPNHPKSNRPPSDEILPVYRRDSHEEIFCGSHSYPGRGVYLLKFDNSYSLWRSKTLYYRVYYTR